MIGFGVSFLIGVVCIALGIANWRGNIESIHAYHRKRVAEENRVPFGRMVGMGTIIIGAGVCVDSILSAITVWTENGIFALVGTIVMGVAIVVGLVISFWAMIKYNKGIF